MANVTTKSDEEIQRDVFAELKWDGRIHPNEIGVTVDDGVVTLRGKINSLANRRAAEEAARRVGGVRAVANELEVRLPIEFKRTDSEIAAAAVRALEWDTLLPKDTIQVTVSDGWIELSGEVDASWVREEADDAVTHLRGVRGVTNLIEVQPAVSVEETKERIAEAFVRGAQTDAAGISVEVHGSTVILRGTVHSLAEKNEADAIAAAAPGVTFVDNRLIISL